MTQLPTGPRRTRSGDLDIYTGLALAGTIALAVAAVILWMAGTELAEGQLPFTILQ